MIYQLASIRVLPKDTGDTNGHVPRFRMLHTSMSVACCFSSKCTTMCYSSRGREGVFRISNMGLLPRTLFRTENKIKERVNDWIFILKQPDISIGCPVPGASASYIF